MNTFRVNFQFGAKTRSSQKFCGTNVTKAKAAAMPVGSSRTPVASAAAGTSASPTAAARAAAGSEVEGRRESGGCDIDMDTGRCWKETRLVHNGLVASVRPRESESVGATANTTSATTRRDLSIAFKFALV